MIRPNEDVVFKAKAALCLCRIAANDLFLITSKVLKISHSLPLTSALFSRSPLR